MKHINDAVIRMLDARIRVQQTYLREAIDKGADDEEIERLTTSVREYTKMLENLKKNSAWRRCNGLTLSVTSVGLIM